MSIDQIGLKLLRVAPLISSTAGVMCAWGQQFAVYSFIDKTVPQEPAGATLPYWFPVLFSQLTWAVGIIHPLGALLGLWNSIGASSESLDPQTRYFYFLGGLFAAGHLFYGKAAMAIINTIWNDRLPGTQNLRALSPWLRLNRQRVYTANIPAFIFFLLALLSAVGPKE